MPEIGEALREARMRAHIDVTEIEARTKIRSKYLRALENEEWDLLPGPTYVKSFLRTYADALGLDSRMLVEEYKLRHERPEELELQPRPTSTARGGRDRGPRAPRVPRWAFVAAVAVALIVVLALLGSGGGGNSTGQPTNSATTGGLHGHRHRHHAGAGRATGTAHRPQVTVQILPSAAVYVCVKTTAGHTLANGVILQPGVDHPTYRSAHDLLLQLGNSSAKLRVNGRTESVPSSSVPIGFVVGTHGRRQLPAAGIPKCA